MSKKLGKIKKPLLETFQESRKLYCVPLIPYFQSDSITKDLQEKISLYWKQADEQINNLEKAGKITTIYHESICSSGLDGMRAIKQINEKSYQLVKAKCKHGAKLQALEDMDLLNEYTDWSMCLSVVGRSHNVFNTIIDFQEKAAKKRNENIVKNISETLRDKEAGMVIITDEHRVRIQPDLPLDMQVFLVHPPAFNDVRRSLRKYLIERMREARD